MTAPAAIVMLVRDIWHDLHHRGYQDRQSSLQGQGTGDLDGAQRRTESGERSPGSSPRQPEVIEMTERSSEAPRPSSLTQRFSTAKPPMEQMSDSGAAVSGPSRALGATTSATTLADQRDDVEADKKSAASAFRVLSHRLPTVSYVVGRLPLPLLPFAFSMFILVEALQHVGWIRIWGGWWKAWVDIGGIAGAVWLMAVLSVIGCNVSKWQRISLVLMYSSFVGYRPSAQTSELRFYSAVYCNTGAQTMRFRIAYYTVPCTHSRWGATMALSVSRKLAIGILLSSC